MSSGELIQVKNFVNNEFVEAKDFLDSFDPSTGDVIARIPDSSPDDVNVAVAAAKEAFKT